MKLRTRTIATLFASSLVLAAAHAQAPAAPAKPATPPATPAAPAMPAAPAGPRKLAHEGAMPSAKDIFAKHLAAVGGDKAWEAKTGMKTEGAMEVPAAGLKGTMKTTSMVPSMVLVELDLPGIGKTASGFDGTTGWSMDPMRGPSLMDEQQVAQLKRDGNFRRDLDLARDPGKAETLGLFEFEGTPCWQVRTTWTDGTDAMSYYERDSGLMKGMSMSTSTPMGDLPVTIVNDEYKDFDGVKVATRMVTKVMGQQQVMTVEKVEWNAVKADDFALPAEIRTLRDAPKSPAAPAGGAQAPKAPAAPAPPAGTK
jgi:hypothetical protein